MPRERQRRRLTASSDLLLPPQLIATRGLTAAALLAGVLPYSTVCSLWCKPYSSHRGSCCPHDPQSSVATRARPLPKLLRRPSHPSIATIAVALSHGSAPSDTTASPISAHLRAAGVLQEKPSARTHPCRSRRSCDSTASCVSFWAIERPFIGRVRITPPSAGYRIQVTVTGPLRRTMRHRSRPISSRQAASRAEFFSYRRGGMSISWTACW